MNNLLDVLFLAEDDHTRPQPLADLTQLGFKVHRYSELAELYNHVSQHNVSLIVLTGRLPKIHVATAQLRAMRHTLGIIVLASFPDSEARVRTLLCGADACLDVATSGLELAAVFQSLLRRVPDTPLAPGGEPASTPRPASAEHGGSSETESGTASGWRLASKGWTLIAPAGQQLALTTAERGFLLRLARAPDKKVSRDTLISDGLHSGDPAEGERRGRFVDVMISRMRRKAAAQHMRLPIKAVHGWGYMFTAEVAEDTSVAEEGGFGSPRVSLAG